MKLQKFLLLGLLGICVPLTMATSCGDKPPVDNPDVVPHHPTSSFDKCPLLAHIDNPKLGIKEITVEFYYGDRLENKCIYEYDQEQRLVKMTNDRGTEVEYEYDAKGCPTKIVTKYEKSVDMTETFFYDEYGFLTKRREEGSEGYVESKFRYKNDTVFEIEGWSDGSNYEYVTIYSKDVYPIYTTKTEMAYEEMEWDKGNCVSVKYDNEEVREYEYDEKENISRLLSHCYERNFFKEDLCKNNRLGYYSYTYTEKGMVATKLHDSEIDGQKHICTYIYY